MTLTPMGGGDGCPPEPDWTLRFNDELDQALAHEEWGIVIREMQEMATLHVPISYAPASEMVSACVRCTVPTAAGTAPGSGATSAYTWRSVDKTNVNAQNVSFYDSNSYDPGTAGTGGELASGVTACYRMALVTGITGGGTSNTPAANQSAATATQLTFTNMLSNSAFTASGGTVTDSGRYICVPSAFGGVFGSDPSGVSLTKGQYFAEQAEQAITETGSGVRPLKDFSQAAAGDLRASSAADNSQVYATNWSVATGGGTPAPLASYTSAWQPLAVLGTGDPGVHVVINSGDSVEHEYNALTPNVDGVVGFARTALDEQGYSFLDAATPGTKPSDFVNFPAQDTVRLWLQQWADVNLDAGLNDRGVIAAWGTGAGDGGEWDVLRKYDLRLQAASHVGWRMVKVTMPPHTTDTASPGWIQVNLSESGNVVTMTPYVSGVTFGTTFTGGGTVSVLNASVAAYDVSGYTPAATSSSSITFNLATTGLAATSGYVQDDFRTQAFATAADNYITGWQYLNDYQWLMGQMAYGARNTSLGDPSGAFDLYTTVGGSNGLWVPAARLSTSYATTPGTHLTDSETATVKPILKAQLSGLLGF